MCSASVSVRVCRVSVSMCVCVCVYVCMWSCARALSCFLQVGMILTRVFPLLTLVCAVLSVSCRSERGFCFYFYFHFFDAHFFFFFFFFLCFLLLDKQNLFLDY